MNLAARIDQLEPNSYTIPFCLRLWHQGNHSPPLDFHHTPIHIYQPYIYSNKMGKVEKSLKSFIESLPNDKLTSISTLGATLYKDENYRLDMQGVCFFYYCCC